MYNSLLKHIEIIKEGNNFSGWDTDKNGKKWEDYDYVKVPNGSGGYDIVNMIKLQDDLETAKAALVHLQPFFVAFVNKLHWIYTFRVATQATDGYYLLMNPKFTYDLTMEEKVFVMAHEIMHCVLNHMRRGKGHDQGKSNIAADYECNITLADEMDLVSIGTMKGLGAYVDKKYSRMGYEAIYDSISGSGKGSQDNSNSKQSKGKEKEEDGEKNGSDNNNSSSNNSQTKSADYKAGWVKAVEDWKNGKIPGLPPYKKATNTTPSTPTSSSTDKYAGMSVDDLRKQRGNVAVKINSWKKSGKDTSALQAELEDIRAAIRNMK